ncbi:MAG: ATP-binding cassette domain-containing protein [Chloroflexota bacterium]
MSSPLLKIVGLSKTYGDSLQALNQVSFDVSAGEIVGLAGNSGAGKSVITSILAGLESFRPGEVYFDGDRLTPPWQPRELGIEIIHQEPELVNQLDITSNIFLGSELAWSRFLPWQLVPDNTRMDQQATEILEKIGFKFPNLREPVINLPAEQRQILAIARVMTREPKMLIVDDPSDLLSIRYQEKLLELLTEWGNKNTAVIFASNNLDHLFAVTDRIVILRNGQVIDKVRTDETSRESLVGAMVGTRSQNLTPAIWALDRYYRARQQAENLQRQQGLLEQDLMAQGNLNQQLVEELAIQVRALDQANSSLQDAQRRLMTEREQERKHLARELHDQVIQDLLGTNYQIEAIELSTNDELSRSLEEIRTNIRGMVDDLRRICGDLRPPTIDSLGLGAAINSFVRDWSDRTGVPVDLEISKDLGRLPEAIELSVFRIVQEGLNNIWRHANSSLATIDLARTSPRTLLLTIQDDGVGLPEDFNLAKMSAGGHYGVLGISERVALLGGRLQLQNRKHGGTMLQVEIPHPRQRR